MVVFNPPATVRWFSQKPPFIDGCFPNLSIIKRIFPLLPIYRWIVSHKFPISSGHFLPKKKLHGGRLRHEIVQLQPFWARSPQRSLTSWTWRKSPHLGAGFHISLDIIICHPKQVYIHVYIYIYILCCITCIYVCMYAWMYGWMHVCMHVCMYAGMHVCMYACMYVCMHACMYLCVYVCILYIVYCISLGARWCLNVVPNLIVCRSHGNSR